MRAWIPAHALGAVVWRKLLVGRADARAFVEQGIVPLLVRLKVECTQATGHPSRPVLAHGGYRLAHTKRDGDVDRIVMDLWAELKTDGEVLGRVYGEDVFTRVRAPAGQRKVTELPVVGLPDERAAQPGPAHLLELPAGAEALDDAFVCDAIDVLMSTDHSDLNQHVNSLVYPELMAEAGLRRLVSHGVDHGMLVRSFEVCFRKPMFAGQTASMYIRSFRLGASYGVCAAIVPLGEGVDAKPYATAQIGW